MVFKSVFTRMVALSRFLPQNISEGFLGSAASLGAIPTFEAYTIPLDRSIAAYCIPQEQVDEMTFNNYNSAMLRYLEALTFDVEELQQKGCGKTPSVQLENAQQMRYFVSRIYDVHQKLSACKRDMGSGYEREAIETPQSQLENLIHVIRKSAADCAVEAIVSNARRFTEFELPMRHSGEDQFHYLANTLNQAFGSLRYTQEDVLPVLVGLANYGNANCRVLEGMSQIDYIKQAWSEMNPMGPEIKTIQAFENKLSTILMNADFMIRDCAHKSVLEVKPDNDIFFFSRYMGAAVSVGTMAEPQFNVMQNFYKPYLVDRFWENDIGLYMVGVCSLLAAKQAYNAYKVTPSEKLKGLGDCMENAKIQGSRALAAGYLKSLYCTIRILDTLKAPDELTSWKGYREHISFPQQEYRQVKHSREDISWKPHKLSKEFYMEKASLAWDKYTDW